MNKAEYYIPTKQDLEKAQSLMSDQEKEMTKMRETMIVELGKLGKTGYIEKYSSIKEEVKGVSYMKTTNDISMDILQGIIDNHIIKIGRTKDESKRYHEYFILDGEKFEDVEYINRRHEVIEKYFAKYGDIAIDLVKLNGLKAENKMVKNQEKIDFQYEKAEKLLA